MPAKVLRLLLVAFAAGIVAPVAARAAHSDWAEADEARMRLLIAQPGAQPGAQAGAQPDGESITGGIELEIAPGWYTYWRNPGETGVPPIFDFSGSDNVADVKVRYPAPERHEDAGSVSLIYQNGVVFPLAITPKEPGKPLTLRLEAKFGVCSAVCIPTSASAELMLDGKPDPLVDARLKAYAPRVPGPAEPGRFDIEDVRAHEDALLIDVLMPQSSYQDLFADPPQGWYIGQPVFVAREGGVSHYRLSLAGRPKGAEASGLTFRFVAVSGGEAIEEAVKVD